MSAHGNATVTAGRVPCAAECASARVPRFDRNITTNGLLSDPTGSLSGRFSYSTVSSHLSLTPRSLPPVILLYSSLLYLGAQLQKDFFFFALPTLFASLVCFSVPKPQRSKNPRPRCCLVALSRPFVLSFALVALQSPQSFR